jgi:hypothetical protein
MNRRKNWSLALAGCVMLAPGAVADRPSLIPDDVTWGAVLDLQKVQSSPLIDDALNHLPAERREVILDKVDGLSNILGLDLRGDLGQLVAFGHGFGPDSVGLAMEIGRGQTNLEGLLLAGENYQSYDHQGTLIHSIKQSSVEPRLHAAVLPPDPARPGLLLVSPGSELVEAMLEQSRLGATPDDAPALADDQWLRMWVSAVPDDMFEANTRQSNIAGWVETVEMLGTTEADGSVLSLDLHMVNPDRARMLRQMAAGFKAMVEFAAADNVDAQKMSELLAYVAIDQPGRGDTVRFRAHVSREDVGVVLDMLDRAGAFDELDL